MTTQPEDLRSEPATPTEGGEQPQVPDPTQYAEPAGAVAVGESGRGGGRRGRRPGPAGCGEAAAAAVVPVHAARGVAARCCSRCLAFTPSLLPRSAARTGPGLRDHRRDRLRRRRGRAPGSGARSPTGTRARPGPARGGSSPSSPSSRWSRAFVLGQRWQSRDPRPDGGGGAATRPPCCWCRWWPPSCSSPWSRWPAACGRLYRWLARLLGRWIGPRAARAVGWVAVVGVTIALVSGVLLDGLVVRRRRGVLGTQRHHHRGRACSPPTRTRSGGPGSLVAWDTLGREGRKFTGARADRVGHRRVHRRAGAARRSARTPGLESRGLDRGPRRAGRRRPGARRRLRPRLPGRRHDHRQRLGRPGLDRHVRVPDRRRLGDRRDPVLVPAVLDLLPGRPGAGPGGRPRALRRRLRPVVGAAAGQPAQAARVRREPRLVRRGDRVQRRARPAQPHRPARSSPGRRTSTRSTASSPTTATRAASRSRRSTGTAGRSASTSDPGAADRAGGRSRGTDRGCSTCSTRPTRSSGGAPRCC